jgi:F0F1-type ATP synthase assembly protein I
MQPNIIKSSMQNGLILGILFSVNFLLSISKAVPLVLLSYLLMGFILVITYRTTIRFRDIDCLGSINFSKTFSFIILTFFFAALISSIVKYFYFQFINPDYLAKLLDDSMKAVEMLNLSFGTSSYDQMEKMMKPATFSLQFIWMNVLMGTLIGLIMAPFIKKDKNIFEK